jgi:hypothetical protein
MEYAGALYLIYLGVRAFLEKTELSQLAAAPPITAVTAFRQGILSEILNPKTALFFLAFLPQFVHPENGPVIAQFAVLGVVFAVMSARYTSLLAIGAGAFAAWLSRYRGFARWQGKGDRDYLPRFRGSARTREALRSGKSDGNYTLGAPKIAFRTWLVNLRGGRRRRCRGRARSPRCHDGSDPRGRLPRRRQPSTALGPNPAQPR